MPTYIACLNAWDTTVKVGDETYSVSQYQFPMILVEMAKLHRVYVTPGAYSRCDHIGALRTDNYNGGSITVDSEGNTLDSVLSPDGVANEVRKTFDRYLKIPVGTIDRDCITTISQLGGFYTNKEKWVSNGSGVSISEYVCQLANVKVDMDDKYFEIAREIPEAKVVNALCQSNLILSSTSKQMTEED
jgi:hypothetical protein